MVLPALLCRYPCIYDAFSVKLYMVSPVAVRMYSLNTHLVFTQPITDFDRVSLAKYMCNQSLDPVEFFVPDVVLF